MNGLECVISILIGQVWCQGAINGEGEISKELGFDTPKY